MEFVDIIIEFLPIFMFLAMGILLFIGYPVGFILGGVAVTFGVIGYMFGVYPEIVASSTIKFPMSSTSSPLNYVNKLKKRFSPYCSVATWYLWRSIDDEPIQY